MWVSVELMMMKETCRLKVVRSMDSKRFEVGMSEERSNSEHRILSAVTDGRSVNNNQSMGVR